MLGNWPQRFSPLSAGLHKRFAKGRHHATNSLARFKEVLFEERTCCDYVEDVRIRDGAHSFHKV